MFIPLLALIHIYNILFINIIVYNFITNYIQYYTSPICRYAVGRCRVLESGLSLPRTDQLKPRFLVIAIVASLIGTCFLAIIMLLVYRKYFNKQSSE